MPPAGAVGVTPEEIVIDFHFQNFAFCKELRFNQAKTSVTLSIFKTVLEQDNLRVPMGNVIKKSFQAFEALVLAHSVERPPIR
jgi:hypothetical protein